MKRLIAVLFLSFLGVAVSNAQFHTNTITTPGDSYGYSVDGSDPVNPTIYLEPGVTNILDIQTYADHPVAIVTDDFTALYGGANPQAVNNEPITLNTPSVGFPTTLIYMCAIHGFYGEIHLSHAPPPNTILEVRIGTNVVMTSTGTGTTWNLIPE